MKLRWKIVMGVAVLLLLAFGLGQWSDYDVRAAVKETRHELGQQGWKLDVEEFNLTISPEFSWRATRLGQAGEASHDLLPPGYVMAMQALGSNPPHWSFRGEKKFETHIAEDLWPVLRAQFDNHRELLDRACEAALSGPIRFAPVSRGSVNFILPHLSGVKQLALRLQARSILDLHEKNQAAAWTNLLALTRLATAWMPEPFEISHLVRFACVAIAQKTVWEFLQADGLTDAQLASLQREWESAELWNDLPEIAALSRATSVATCQSARQAPLSITARGGMLRGIWPELLFSPTGAARELRAWGSSYVHERRYRNRGAYEDERALMLYFRDRELEMRRAVNRSNWLEMRLLAGVTNVPSFQGTAGSPIATLLNLRRTGLGFQSAGKSFLAGAAETEARRRLIVTAIALKRFQLRHGAYPQELPELFPSLLSGVPLDFMDGKPLRYRHDADGRFLLYSVGLDCVDHGGQMPTPQFVETGLRSPPRSSQATDLVWPLPATPAEVEALPVE